MIVAQVLDLAMKMYMNRMFMYMYVHTWCCTCILDIRNMDIHNVDVDM